MIKLKQKLYKSHFLNGTELSKLYFQHICKQADSHENTI